MNSESNDDGFTYPGGSDDSLGTDDGTRAFPAALSAGLQEHRGNLAPTNILQTLNGDGNFHFLSEAEAINRDLAVSLNRDVEIGNKSLPPDGGLEFSLGNRWFFGEEESWEFGALGLVSYDNTWRNRERTERDVADPINLVENRFRTINQVSATGVLNLGLNFTSDHQLTTSSFYLRNTEDESSISTRTNNNFQISNGQQLRDYDIRFEERELVANQIRGRHVIGADTQEYFSCWTGTSWTA